MRYRHLLNYHRNMSGFLRAPRTKGAAMAKKKSKKRSKKKSAKKKAPKTSKKRSSKKRSKKKASKKKGARRNRKATSRYNKATGQWESTGVVKSKKKRSKKKASKKKATKKRSSKKSSKRRNPPGAGLPREASLALAASDLSQKAKRLKAQNEALQKESAHRKAKWDEGRKLAGELASALKQCESSAKRASDAAKAAKAAAAACEARAPSGKGGKGGKGGKKRGKKRPRPGTKSKQCAPFIGKRKRPVKCRPKPSKESLDGCGLAARKHGLDPKETCGPGLPKPPGRTLATKRHWGTTNRNFWGD